MKSIYIIFVLLVFLASCTSVKNYNEQITRLHPVSDLQADVDAIYFQLQKHHPRLYQYTSKETFDFKIDSLKASIQTPLTSRDFYKKLAPVVAHVRQGHISVGSVSKRYTKKERKQLLKTKFEFYDLEFEYLNNKLWVSKAISEDSTLIGSEVVKIEDDSISNLVKIYKTRFATDGFNKTLFNRYLGKGFSGLYFKDKGFVDSLSVTFKMKDSLFNKTFERVEKDKKQDTISNDTLKTIKKPKLTKEEKIQNRIASKEKRRFNKKHGFISRDKSYTRNFKLLEADSTVAFMKIRAFSNGNYKKFYNESFAELHTKNIQNLIIDLRDNGGGRLSEIDFLYAYLSDKNYQLIQESEVNSRLPYFKFLMSNTTPNSVKIASGILSPFILVHNLIKTKKRDGKLYYNFRFSKDKQPNDLHFKGTVYVLINGNSFSASSLLSTHLKATDRAFFVGEETGGAYNGCVAGIYKIYQIPNSKLKIRMGLMQIETMYKQNPDGYGVKPDKEILPTSDELLIGKDAQLEWIIQDIKNKHAIPN